MTAPPCPELARELTQKILDVEFTDDIKIERYSAYIWLMHVLLSGGWADFSAAKYEDARNWLKDTLGMWGALQPWLCDSEFTDEDITAHLVDRVLFDDLT